jgi:two-component system probable response regulator PhcQ
MKDNILIVDDDLLTLAALRKNLEDENHNVLEAKTGNEALEIMHVNKIDLVVSDNFMPGLAGIELLSLIKKNFPQTVRIMVSGHPNLDLALEAINRGEIYRFFKKPVDFAEVTRAVSSALAQKKLIQSGKRFVSAIEAREIGLSNLEAEIPGITKVNRAEDGAIIVDSEDLSLDKVVKDLKNQLEFAEHGLGTKLS